MNYVNIEGKKIDQKVFKLVSISVGGLCMFNFYFIGSLEYGKFVLKIMRRIKSKSMFSFDFIEVMVLLFT